MRRPLASIAFVAFAASGCIQTVAVSPCGDVSCSGHGTCVDLSGAAACVCETGFAAAGLECKPVDSCSPNPCAEPHRSRCKASGSAAICSCDEGFWDLGECVAAVSCTPNPCTSPHKGLCRLDGATVSCGCDDGYRDDGAGGCVVPDPCTPNPCVEPRRTACSARGGTAVCSCDEGTWDRGACVPAVSCDPNPCSGEHRTACTWSGSEVHCGCDEGYVDDLAGGCALFDPCSPNPCSSPNRTVCLASGVAVLCSCEPGYRDDGAGGCVEACKPNPCNAPHQTLCGPGPGGFQCSCDFGYVADGSGGCKFEAPTDCAAAHEEGDAYEPDECPELARVVVPPISSESHTLDRFGDVDWVVVDVGDEAALVVTAQAASVFGVDVAVFDAVTYGLLASASGEWGTTSLAIRTGARRFLVRVQSQAVADYRLTLERYADDGPNTASQALPLTSGAPVSGNHEYAADVDWFSFSAAAGRIYRVDVTHDEGLTCELYDESGAQASSSSPLTSASHFNSGAFSFGWRATLDGTYYLKLLPKLGDMWGTYEVKVTDVGTDDFADDASQAAKVSVGSAQHGSLGFVADEDWFSFDAVVGHVHQVKVVASSAATVSLLDGAQKELALTGTGSWPILAKLSRSDPYYVRLSQVPNLASVLTYDVQVSDLGLDDYGDSASEATPLTLGQGVGGNVQFAGDADWFSFATVPGRVYEAALSTSASAWVKLFASDGTTELRSGTSTWPISFGATSAGPSYLAVVSIAGSTGAYTLTVSEKGTDDFGNAAVEAAPLSMGVPVHGVLEYGGDEDWFSAELEAGHIYRMEFAPSGFTARVKVYQGTTTAADVSTSPLSFTASATGTYHVAFGSWYGTSTGAYTLSLTDEGTDDHADSSAAATPLVLGTLATGSIQYAGDVDWLRLPTESGRIYRVRVVPSGLSATVKVLGHDGTTEVASQSSYSAVELVFQAAETGSAFVGLSSQYPGGVGDYTVLAEDLGTDDAGNTAATAKPLTVGAGPVTGVIQYQYPADVDVYAFEAAAGDRLSVTLSGSLAASWWVKASAGDTLASGVSGTTAVDVPSAGTWYLGVGAATPRSLGQYTVDLSK